MLAVSRAAQDDAFITAATCFAVLWYCACQASAAAMFSCAHAFGWSCMTILCQGLDKRAAVHLQHREHGRSVAAERIGY